MTPRTDIEDMTDAQDEAQKITMTYRNWRGEVGTRTIQPLGLRFDTTEWHPEPGWLLEAWDFDKGAVRDFALADCQFADLARPPRAGDERVARLRDVACGATTTIAHALDDGQIDEEVVGNFEALLTELNEAIAALAAMDTPKGGGDE